MRLVGLILALLPLAATAGGVPAIAAFDAASAPVLNDPRDPAPGPDGRRSIADTGAGMIVAFRGGVPVFAARGLFRPHDAVVDGDGNLWVADTGNARFEQFSPDGKPVALPGKEDDADPTRFSRPNGVETEGALFWFADAGTGRILHRRPVLN